MIDRVSDYAFAVANGDIPAGQSQKLACIRHLNDLKRQGTEEFPYYWDVEKANDIIDFMELLVIAEGDEPEPLNLAGFQAFCFGSLNGWVNKDGYRRFRTSYIQLARQQGKSLFNGGMTLYYGNFAGYQYPQIYACATKQDQAAIVLKEAIKFIHADPELEATFKVKAYENSIECKLTNGMIKALGADTKRIDGFRPYFGSVDEFHAHKTDQMYKLLVSGTKRLKETLISVITTSGFDLNSPCHQLYKYCKSVLSGAVVDETQFIFIAELDEEDDPFDEEVWKKSNPLWDETTLQSLQTFAIKAKEMGGSELMEFMTKSLNMWVEFSDSSYIKATAWSACGSERDLEEFLKMHPDAKCFAGLDLSSGGDLTSLALVFVYQNQEGQRKYYVYTHSFIPSNRVLEHEKTDKAPYRMWVRSKQLTVTETLGGIKTDYKYIIAHLKELIEKYDLDIQMICYDNHNAAAFLNDLEDLGFPSVEIKQSARNLNDPTCDFALEVEAGNVEYHKANELMSWSILNAKVVHNSFKEMKIDKLNQFSRIDVVDAIIDAWKMAMGADTISLQTATEDYLTMMGW